MRHLVTMMLMLTVSACHGRSEEAPETPVARVHCVPVEIRQWSETRSLRGTVAPLPDRDAIVSAQVPGRLLRVLVREGDMVERGAVLAEVESRPSRDALRQAEALLEQARAQHEAAELAATREEHLFERGISARQSFEAARAAEGQADGAIALATAQVDVARQNVERATVRAPIGGVVVRLSRRVGEVVDGTPTTPIMEIADPTSLELAASVSASTLVSLRAGQVATVSFDALPGRTFSASVRTVSPAVDPMTGVGSVRLSLETAESPIPIGILGTAEVQVGAAQSVDVVPATAVRSAGGANTEVVVCDGGQAHPRPVVVGERRDGFVQIVSGLRSLTAPVRIATDGLIGLEEGTVLQEEP
ncbi:MAG: efflux RND transporter periplasmic adaptor subunit [Polyangiales bacterium]